jgi:hypothetical protein
MAVIAIAAFFVVSSLSLSNRLDEGRSVFRSSPLLHFPHTFDAERTLTPDYAPRNWRYRWILLDGSLALIYLMVFMAVAWLWRPVSLVSSFLFHLRPNLTFPEPSFLLNPSIPIAIHDSALCPPTIVSRLTPTLHQSLSNQNTADGRPETMSDSQCRKN